MFDLKTLFIFSTENARYLKTNKIERLKTHDIAKIAFLFFIVFEFRDYNPKQ
jgi:hypothetical protein